MATQSSASSSSAPLPKKKYNVFLSFRGEDTRHGFTDHLYNALLRDGISTFRDDQELEGGQEIAPYLLTAIEQSQVAVVIFSEDYASSTWCLEELSKITECMKKKELEVLPVFYHVNPSDVRKHRGSFGQALIVHEKRVKADEIERWKTALTEVASLSGWHVEDQYESSIVDGIMDRISRILKNSFISETTDIVVFDHMKSMNSWANNRPGDVCFIGIWGMGGIGKTTFATFFYERNCNKFEACSFLANVRENSRSTDGVAHLQERLLSDVLQRPSKRIQYQDFGKKTIKERLCSRKVLVVLDDVSDGDQLDALAGNPDWFGLGSKIVVTTRNKHLLLAHGFDEGNICTMQPLTDEEALTLFCLKAFKNCRPDSAYINLCKPFVSYTGNNPLALKVLGSLLCGKSTREWTSKLKRLKEYPEEKIMSILRISYDDLGPLEKNVFLDIACFFKGWGIKRVKPILESCDFFPDDSITILEERSLISSLENTYWMHDLLQEMAQYIVREESYQRPEERSRLWLHLEIQDVLENNKGTNKIEGISLVHSPEKIILSNSALSKMDGLRILDVRNLDLPEGLDDLSNKLRLLTWYDYPLKFMPSSFQPAKLVELNMPRSRIQRFWAIHKQMDKLICIDLSYSCLHVCPDFNWMPNLELLSFKGCSKLKKIHPSITTLKRLVLLDLSDCIKLRTLPGDLDLVSLQELKLSSCYKLMKLPGFSGNMRHLTKLNVSRAAIKELPPSIGRLTSLAFLNMEYCENLTSLPSTLIEMTSIKSLKLSGCSKLAQIPQNLESLECLEKLNLSRTAIIAKSTPITLPKNLKELHFREVQSVESPRLFIPCCRLQRPNPRSITPFQPSSFLDMHSLKTLDLCSCNLPQGAVPEDLGNLHSLKWLDLGKNNFVTLPDSICNISKLEILDLRDCDKLQRVPALPLSIKAVCTYGCSSLEDFPHKQVMFLPWSAGFSSIWLRGNYQHIPSEESLRHKVLQICSNEDVVDTFSMRDIPEWFNSQSIGSSISLPLPAQYVSIIGVAVCFTMVATQDTLSVPCDICETKKKIHKAECNLFLDETPLASLCINIECSDQGAFIYKSLEHHVNGLEFKASIQVDCPRLQKEKCGAKLFFKKDVTNIVRTSYWYPSALRDKGYYRWHHILQPLHHSLEGESCSNITGIFQFLSLLKRKETQPSTSHYQETVPYPQKFNKSTLPYSKEDWSYRDDTCYYNFAMEDIPEWFSHQKEGCEVEFQVPENLYENDEWLGLVICAQVIVQQHPDCTVSDSALGTSSYLFCELHHFNTNQSEKLKFLCWNSDLKCNSFPPLQRPIIWMGFIPRRYLPLWYVESGHIEATLVVAPGLQVQRCAMRLLFTRDKMAFLDTLVWAQAWCKILLS